MASIADGPDADKTPEGVPMSGTVTFIASPGYVIDYSAVPNPVTILKTPIMCRLDDEGYLCSPYSSADSPLSRGVMLVATDDPDLQPVGWNWTVMYDLIDPNGFRVAMPNQTINVPTDTVVDLAYAMNVAASNGTIITKGDPNTLTVGTVTTGMEAQVNISGTSPNQTIDFVLPEASAEQKALAIALAIAL
ncbi:hypothetical protein SEA_ATUIN_180 [Arthrobacter phage Atuin]|nr:hypothetical protein SEA_ATUIN_279 [Arthrobacter phage Atuin]